MKRPEDEGNRAMTAKELKTHGGYIIAFLVVVIIGLLSTDLAGNERLAEILAFAVGFASLILAIIAIIQSLSSQPSISRSLSDVSDAAARVESAAQNLQLLSGAIHDRLTVVATIPAQLDAVRGDLDRALNRPISDHLPPFELHSAQEDPTQFLEAVTPGSLAAIYGCIRAFDLQRQFDPNEAIPGDTGHYCAGVCAGLMGNPGFSITRPDGISGFAVWSMAGLTIEDVEARLSRPEVPVGSRETFEALRLEIDGYFARPAPEGAGR